MEYWKGSKQQDTDTECDTLLVITSGRLFLHCMHLLLLLRCSSSATVSWFASSEATLWWIS